MTACDSIETQKTTLDLTRGDPQNLISSIKRLHCRKTTLDDWITYNRDNQRRIDFTDSYEMPRHLNWNIIKKIYDIQPKNYEEI